MKPIIFSTEMVKAILEGRKTQTRRVMKDAFGDPIKLGISEEQFRQNLKVMSFKCPYGQVGDRLWVRETWLPDPPRDFDGYVEFGGCWPHPLYLIPQEYRTPNYCVFKASWQGAELRYHSAMLMPRWASRITLEITGIRVERVQEISEDDAANEGIRYADGSFELEWFTPAAREAKRILDFSKLWDSINAKRGYSWEENPWVWVIEFKQVNNLVR